MSSMAVRTAFRTAFAAALPTVTLKNIENVAVDFPTDVNGRVEAFAGVLYFATETALAIGDPTNRRWRETGTINVLIYYPAGYGIDGAAQLADTIRNALGGRDLVVSSPGIRLTLLDAQPLTQYLGSPGEPTGLYSIGAVGLSYEYDFLR